MKNLLLTIGSIPRCRYLLLLLIFSGSGCHEAPNEKALAEQYCASCHLFPSPPLLDKKTWRESILPRMGERLGMNTYDLLSEARTEDIEVILGLLPYKPLLSEKEWKGIVHYYEMNAPDTLDLPVEIGSYLPLKCFEPFPVKASNDLVPSVTMIKADIPNRKIFVGTRRSTMLQLDYGFHKEDSFYLPSPPSYIILRKEEKPIVSVMGIMDPNDQPAGWLLGLDLVKKKYEVILDSLKRPVFFEKADFNGDLSEDYLVCNYGNFTGDLSVYDRSSGQVKKHNISQLPGARKFVLKDFNRDGKLDILSLIAQGDEQVTLFVNKGDFVFEPRVLMRFPPVYGSSNMDTLDINQDGWVDIICTNGDNADYSQIFKPYHGIRILTNQGDNVFKESTFIPMYGATQVLADDYDLDGDIDLASISFFPDFKNHPERGFVYFENHEGKFTPHVTDFGAKGRWMVMEKVDIDGDGDQDLLLGALNFIHDVPETLLSTWNSNPVALLLLRNRTKQKRQ